MLEFVCWYVTGCVWLAFALAIASDRGWLDPIAESRAMRLVDRWIGPVWRCIYRWTGAAALDRRLTRRNRARSAADVADLAVRLDAAGLDTAAETMRTAAVDLLTR